MSPARKAWPLSKKARSREEPLVAFLPARERSFFVGELDRWERDHVVPLTLAPVALETPSQAVSYYLDSGLQPILIHAPGPPCSCRKQDCSEKSWGKHPIISRWEDRRTFEEIETHRKKLKFEPNVGIVLGRQIGGAYLVAIDVDDQGRYAELVAESGALPETVFGKSGRGHRLLYEIPSDVDIDKLRNKTGLGSLPGVDAKVKNGQIVVAPSLHILGVRYTWERFGEIATLPAKWLPYLLDPAPPTPPTTKTVARILKKQGGGKFSPANTKDEDAFIGMALESALRNVLQAPVGQRNDVLNRESHSLGGRTPRYISRERIVEELYAAILLNGGNEGDLKKIEHAVDKGALRPMVIPPPERQQHGDGRGRDDIPHIEPPPGWPEPPPDDPGLTAQFTDIANAEKLVELHGADLRYVATWKKWMFWDGKRWNTEGSVLRFATLTARVMMKEARTAINEASEAIEKAALASTPDSQESPEMVAAKKKLTWANRSILWAQKSSFRQRLEAMLAVAAADPWVAISHERLDADPWALNVGNGTLDLRLGLLKPHRREDLITKLAPVDFDIEAKAPTWERFLSETMAGKPDVVRYLSRAIGYALTGITRDHALFFFHGGGSNGKSTFLTTIQALLGDYAKPASRTLLFRSRGERHPTESADLYGARFVVCPEINEDVAFDEALVKDLTGGDIIATRRMREDFWKFAPQHKLFLPGNHRPRVVGDDHGIWRRIRLVPWEVQFATKLEEMNGTVGPAHPLADTSLKEKLAAEMSGILAWGVRSCLEWQIHGLGEPIEVTSATQKYREESNLFGEFLRLRCVLMAGASVTRRSLRDAYEFFCQENGEKHPLSAKGFSVKLREAARTLGVNIGRTTIRENVVLKSSQIVNMAVDAWTGIRLLTDVELERRGDLDPTNRDATRPN